MPKSGNKKRLTKRHWLKLPINNIKVQPTTVIYKNPLTHKQKIKSV